MELLSVILLFMYIFAFPISFGGISLNSTILVIAFLGMFIFIKKNYLKNFFENFL